MAKRTDIKVIAPSSNPHICYIPREMERKIKYAKDKTGMSLYRILSASAGFPLSSRGNIQRFKQQLKDLGYKTIGEWAVIVINHMCENRGAIPSPYQKEKNSDNRS